MLAIEITHTLRKRTRGPVDNGKASMADPGVPTWLSRESCCFVNLQTLRAHWFQAIFGGPEELNWLLLLPYSSTVESEFQLLMNSSVFNCYKTVCANGKISLEHQANHG